MKVIVIGGGASGIIAASVASIYADVTIIEGNDVIGKKILITGNGRANFWNKEIDTTKYNKEASTFLSNVLNYQDEVFEYLSEYVGVSSTSIGDYIYPYSKSASSLKTALNNLLEKCNVNILNNLKVKNITIEEKEIKLELNDTTTMKCDKVIIATGGKAASKTGSNGSGYGLLEKLGIQLNPVVPALVPLATDNAIKNMWTGVRTNAKLTLKVNNQIIRVESGEIQLTDYGISGIVTFNISGLIAAYLENHTKFTLSINFLPDLSDNLKEYLNRKNEHSQAKDIEELLETIFNYKLLHALLKASDLKPTTKWKDLTEEEKDNLINNIKEFNLNITNTLDFERAQVCHGGVSLDEITNTFSLKKYPNIKVIGELLDVDGICGGYNLAFAFISGYIAGNNLNN